MFAVSGMSMSLPSVDPTAFPAPWEPRPPGAEYFPKSCATSVSDPELVGQVSRRQDAHPILSGSVRTVW